MDRYYQLGKTYAKYVEKYRKAVVVYCINIYNPTEEDKVFINDWFKSLLTYNVGKYWTEFRTPSHRQFECTYEIVETNVNEFDSYFEYNYEKRKLKKIS